MNQRLKDFLLFLFIITVFFIFVYRNLLNLGAINYGDLSPFSYKIADSIDTFTSAWVNDNFGYPGSSIESSVFNAILQFVLGGSSIWAQKVFFYTAAPISALTTFVFLNYYINSRFGRFVGAFIYGVNPITIGLFYGGSPGGGLLVQYAWFPLQLIFLLRVLDEQGNRKFNIVALSMLLAFTSAYNFQAPLWFFPFLAALVLSHLLIKRDLKYAKRISLSLLASGTLLFLLMFPTFVIQAGGLVGYLFGSEPGVVSFYSATSMSRETLMSRVVLDYQYHTFDTLNIFMCLTGLAAFLSLIMRKQLKYILSFLLVISSLILFWQLSKAGQIWWLYDAIAVLYSINTVKVKMVLAMAFCFLVPFFIDAAEARGVFCFSSSRSGKLARAHKVGRIAVSLTLIIILLIPSFTYDMWPGGTEGRSSSFRYMTGNVNLSQYEVPQVYYDVRRWIDEHSQPNVSFRIFWLPIDPTILSMLMRLFYWTPLFYPRYEERRYVQFIYDYLSNGPNIGWTGGLGKLLAPASVKYIVVNLAANEGGGLWKQEGLPTLRDWGPSWDLTSYLTGQPEEYAKLLDREENLRIVEKNEDFIVYENLDFVPFVGIYDRVFFVAPKEVVNSSHAFPVYNYTGPRTFSNNGGLHEVMWNTISEPGRVGKLFPRRMEGFITTIDFYVRENSGANRTLYVYLSPEVSDNYVASYELSIPANQPPDWLSLTVNRLWPYDKLFIFWYVSDASANWGFDGGMPYDDNYSANISEATWITWNDRPWVRVNSVGKTVYNLLGNPIFEKDTSYWGLAGNWSIDKDAFRSGVNALRGAQNESGWIYALQGIGVESESPYYFTGWIKIENVKQAHVKLNFFDVNGSIVKTTFPLSGTDGTRDWWKFSEGGIVPKTAHGVNVQIVGGWSYDTVQPGKTWFANLSFFEGYYPLPSPISAWNYELMLASSMNHLTDKIPGFNSSTLMASTIMLPFKIGFDQKADQFLSTNDGIVVLGDLANVKETEWVSKQPTIFFIREAESSIVPINGKWDLLEGATFTNGHASKVVGEGEGYIEFFVPRESYYTVALRAIARNNPLMWIDGRPTSIKAIDTNPDGFMWFETNSSFLQKGWNRLGVSAVGEQSILDQIVMLSNTQTALGLQQVVSSSTPKIIKTEHGTTWDNIQVDSRKPAYIVVQQAFNLDWEAYKDGRRVEHYAVPLHMYWANLYYVNSTEPYTLEVRYSQQGTRNISVAIWVVTWLASILCLVYLSRTKILNFFESFITSKKNRKKLGETRV